MKIVTAVDQDDIEALDALKAANQITTSSLQDELLLLQAQVKNYRTDYEQQKSHLVDALLAKDKLRQELAAMNDGKDSAGEENSAALQALKAVSNTIDSPNVGFFCRQQSSPCLSSNLSFESEIPPLELPRSVPQIDEVTMLELERGAVGLRGISKMDNVTIHIHVTRPSPCHLRVRPLPKQLRRVNEWNEDEWGCSLTTLADNIRSKPRNKRR